MERNQVTHNRLVHLSTVALVLTLTACKDSGEPAQTAAPTQYAAVDLTDAQVENIVRRSYQYVAMYNVNNKFAMDPGNPLTPPDEEIDPRHGQFGQARYFLRLIRAIP